MLIKRYEDHLDSCRCDVCEAMRRGEDLTNDDLWEENSRGDSSQYTPNSLVSKQNSRIQELVNAHWTYMERVLSTGQNERQTFTWEQMMAIREWDYTSSAIHFYGHGYEDAVNNQANMEKQNGSK